MDLIYFYIILFFKPRDMPSSNEIEHINERKYISGLILVNTFFSICFSWLILYRLITVKEPKSTYLVLLICFAFLAQNFFIKFNFKWARSLWFLIFGVFVIFPFRAYTTGGLFAPNLLFIALFTFAFVILGKYNLANLFMIFMLAFVCICGYFGSPSMEVSEATLLVTAFMSILVLSLLTSINRYIQDRADRAFLDNHKKKVNAEMALEISHEINNPLSIAYVLSAKMTKKQLDEKDKEALAQSIDRIVKLVRKFQGF